VVVLELPRLVSGRELASAMVAGLGNITDDEVVVDARATTSGTGSFAARLVRDVLVDRRATKLVVVGAPPVFNGYVREAADKLGIAADLIVSSRTMPADASAA
jgi:hypothetical protein